jgi:hypothetical protein
MKFLNLRTVFILTFLTKNKYLRMIWILNLFIFKVKELFSSKKIQVKIIQNYLNAIKFSYVFDLYGS